MTLRIFTEPQQGATYEQLLAVAQTAEECGFDAFFRSDHYLRMGTRDDVPVYTDAWTTLAGLARDTTTIRLGTLVTPVTFRPIGSFPLVAAQVDRMSGGRVEVGLGAGWFGDEHAAYGLPFPEIGARYDLLEDQLAILHGVWSADAGTVFEHAGRTCRVRIEADPVRGVQRPHPPVIVGGRGGSRNARLAAAYADEFNTPFMSVAEMRTAHDAVRAACEAAGRDPASVVYSVAQTVCCGATEEEVTRRAKAIGQDVAHLREHNVAGTPDQVVERLREFAAAGAQRFYLQVLDLDDLDHVRLLAESVLPHLG